MGIKRYIVLALIFIVAVGLYVFSFNGQSFTFEALDFSIALPIAAWIIVPTAVLMIGSVIHLCYYSIKHYLEVRAHRKDYEYFLKAIKQSLLYENTDNTYKTPWFSLPHSLIAQMELKNGATTESVESDELRGIIELVNKVRSGEFVDLKKYRLQQDNPLAIQNQFNKLASNPKMAFEILKDENVDKEGDIYKKAYEIVLSNSSYAEIQRLNLPLSEEDILLILNRYL